MAGIFGAGVVTSLEEENAYPFIEAVYGSSAGVMIAAYFLASQSKLGSSIFYEDLLNNFITPSYVPLGIYDRCKHRFITPLPHGTIRNPIDINYVSDIITGLKRIDMKELERKNIPLYAHVLNTKKLKSEFIDVANHEDPFRILKAAISAAPYYFSSDLQYIDGEIKNCFPITEILEKYPNQRVIAIMNIMPNKTVRRFLKAILEGAVASLMYSAKIWKIYLRKDFLSRKEMRTAQQNSRVTIICPPRELKLWPNTMNKDKLMRAYEAGREEGKKLAKIIKNDTLNRK